MYAETLRPFSRGRGAKRPPPRLYIDSDPPACIGLKEDTAGREGGVRVPLPGREVDIRYLKPDTHYSLVDKYNENKTSINSNFKSSLYFDKPHYKTSLRFFFW